MANGIQIESETIWHSILFREDPEQEPEYERSANLFGRVSKEDVNAEGASIVLHPEGTSDQPLQTHRYPKPIFRRTKAGEQTVLRPFFRNRRFIPVWQEALLIRHPSACPFSPACGFRQKEPRLLSSSWT